MQYYNIFISHVWRENRHYESLISLLNKDTCFQYKDYSIDIDNPVHTSSTSELKLAIKEKMKYASVIIIIAGLYFNHSHWMQYELGVAEELRKPIIAVELYQSKKSAINVKEKAHFITRWNSIDIIEAIKKAANINV